MSPIQIAALAVAYLLAFARLFDAARWAWAWIPPKLQPLAPAVLAAIPAMVEAFTGVTDKMQLTIAIMGALGTLTTAIRGALPATVYQKLPEDAKDALRVARGGESKQGPPSDKTPPTGTPMVTGMLAFVMLGCASLPPEQPPCDAATLAGIVAECSLRVEQNCASKGIAEGDCPDLIECDHRLSERTERCR